MLDTLNSIANGDFWIAIRNIELFLIPIFLFILRTPVGRERLKGAFLAKSARESYEYNIKIIIRGVNWVFKPSYARSIIFKIPDGSSSFKLKNYWVPICKTEDDALRTSENPFSWSALDFCIKISIVYPMLFVFVAWVYSGKDGIIGSYVALPAISSNYLRYTVLVVFGLSICFSLISAFKISRDGISGSLKTLQANGAIFFLLTLSTSILFGLEAMNELAHVLVFVFALVVAVFIVSHFPGSFAQCVATAFVLAASVAAAGLNGGSLNGGGSLGFIFAISLCMGLAVALGIIIERGVNELACYAALLIVVFGILIFSAYITPVANFDVRTWLLFLGIIPLVNAIFDYLSLGVTRFLVVKGLNTGSIASVFLAVVDMVFAFVIITLLCGAVVLAVFLVNLSSEAPLVDIHFVLSDILENPSSYMWLIAALISTLVPTTIHVVVASLSLLSIIPEPVRIFFSKQIESTDDGVKWLFVSVFLSILTLFILFAPIFVIWLLYQNVSVIVQENASVYIEVFVWWANILHGQ